MTALARPLILFLLGASLGAVAAEPANPSGLGAADSEKFKTGSAEARARYDRADWVPEWREEFAEGPSPSPVWWTFERGLLRNHELQYYMVDRRENARIEDGQLIITGRREPWEGAAYTSASVTTKGKLGFLYGKIEIRARFPTGRGMWPALWFMGDKGKAPWPLCGEIDLMENVGWHPEKIHFTVHTGAFNHMKGTQRGRAIVVEKPWTEFHRYGLIWTPERLEFFFDGEKVSEFANDGQGPAHWPFDAPQHLILNLAIGGSWGGAKGVDDGIFPVEFRIDYVRYWKSPAPQAGEKQNR